MLRPRPRTALPALHRRALLAAGGVGLWLACGLAGAQTWPDKPITLVVPFPPGGGTDAFARPLSAQLTKQLGRQVIIDNRGGAGGTVGASVAAKAAPGARPGAQPGLTAPGGRRRRP